MNRRAAINHLVLLSIGGALLPGCSGEETGSIQLKHLSLSGAEVKMLVQLTDAIIPSRHFADDGPVKAHEFTLRMLDDCYEPQQQADYVAGMKAFDLLAKKQGDNFVSLTAAEKVAFLEAIAHKEQVAADVSYFYEVTRRHTVQAYTSSKAYMTKVLNYKMVPGSNFKGCVPMPVKKGDKSS